MRTRDRRGKGTAWIALAAVLAVPAVLCESWLREFRRGAAPETKPARLLAVSLPAARPEPVLPAAPPVSRAPVESIIRLQGLIITEDQPRRAIVNGAIVKEGETIDGATVRSIETGEVTFEAGAELFTKRLGG